MALSPAANALVPLAAVLGAGALVLLAAVAPTHTRRLPAQLDELTRRRLLRQGTAGTGRHRARPRGRPVGWTAAR